MKILYDHQMFSVQTIGGITRYFCELIKIISLEHSFNLSFIFSDNQYIKEDRKFFGKVNILPDWDFKGKSFTKKRLYFLNQLYSKYFISKSNFDLFHPTFYDDYFLKVLKKPYVITVHDLIAFKFKDTFTFDSMVRPQMEQVIKNANRIISISENTKKDLVFFFDLDPMKIDVIYHGYNEIKTNKKIEELGKYILFVGKRERYKNFITLLQAVNHLLQREKDLRLICAGPPFTGEEMSILSKLKLNDKVVALKADDEMLNNLYYNALVFVYPSVYEGFGMPILEAFANHCPVCLSETSSFPEIAGNAGCYFDPSDRDSIAAAVEKVIYNSEYSNKLRELGKSRLKNFSWEQTANQTIETYKKVI